MTTHLRRPESKHVMLCGLDTNIYPGVFGVTQQWHNWRKLVNCSECLRFLAIAETVEEDVANNRLATANLSRR